MSNSPVVFERHIEASLDSQSAIEILAAHCPEVSKQKLKLAMKYGAVWCSEPQVNAKALRIRRAKRPIRKGSTIHIYYNPAILFDPIVPATLVADRDSYSIWNKPCGMFSQGAKWGDHTSIIRWIELFGFERENIPQRETFLVHRLDRATNGLIIVAHTKAMLKKLTALFEAREIVKYYSAVVSGDFGLEKLSKFDTPIDGREALTNILSVDYCEKTDQSILLIEIKTGRKHQIRKHLSAAGYPINNDYLYQQQATTVHSSNRENLMLRSCLLEFCCPESEQTVRFELPRYHQ